MTSKKSEPGANTRQQHASRPAGSDPTPRGIRLNNPGNIRHGKDQWQGAAVDQTDMDFVRFDTPVYGIRAIVRILLNYERKGFDTVAAVINRWAPPKENDTNAYIDHVAAELGVGRREVIDLDLVEIMLPMLKAIIKHENGKQPYSDEMLLQGMRLAGIKDAPLPKLGQKLTGKVLTGAGVGLGFLAQVADPAKTAADSISAFTGAPIIQHLSVILLTLAGIATLAGVAKTYLDHQKGIG